MNNVFSPLRIGDLEAKLPIIQGGMGVRISLSGLASAVANQGGIGVIATPGIGMFEPDLQSNVLGAQINALRYEIRKAKELTKGVLGVNIMVALTHFADLVRTSIEENIDIIFSGAGLPLNLPGFLNGNSRIKLAPIVSSARAANIIIRTWISRYNRVPDLIVVEGPLAGGHLGFKKDQINDPAYSLEMLISQVLDKVKELEPEIGQSIPVVAAGGIFTGGDIHHFLKLGASGVQMATRFVTTRECDASDEFKQAYLQSGPNDLVIIDSPVGMPGRAIQNQFIKDISLGKKKPFSCPYHCIQTCIPEKSPYCIALALANAYKGKMTNGFAFAGANAYRVERIVPVAELIASLTQEYIHATNFKS